MKRALGYLVIPILAFGCSEAPSEVAAGATDAEAEAAPTGISKDELKGLEAELVEIGKLKPDQAKRREACLSFEPKISGRVSDNPNDAKLLQFAAKVSAFCEEATEARRRMTKAAEPQSPVPELSASMKSSFTASLLKGDLATAKALAKKKGDPEEICRRIEMTAKVVGEQKKQDKKTKKLLKEAHAFCNGTAVALGVRFHEQAAQKAEQEEQAGALAEHCTAALVRLGKLPPGKLYDQLEAPLKTTCQEVYALREMLKPNS